MGCFGFSEQLFEKVSEDRPPGRSSVVFDLNPPSGGRGAAAAEP
jgi:hypothetical protein